MNILLVDDNDELRKALAKLLVQCGHMVTHAANGLQAMSAVHHAIDPYDALLTDYAMPNMTGVELAQCVQKKSPSTRIAIMSGDASIAHRIPAGIPFLKKGLFGYDEIAQALQLERDRVENLNNLITASLHEIGRIVLKGLPKDSGYIFHANDVRNVLLKLVVDVREKP